ncbi:MAG TPA: hypothetical protein VFV05_18635 [Methylomirabilota bacterium]|nr:hypothetical protein [Methylomirabilota bacterium]
MVVALSSLLLAGLVGATVRMLAATDGPDTTATAADGARAQQKLFDLARHARRGETVTFTEAEVNALLARHLAEVRGVRLSGLSARLIGGDRIELHARSPLGQILEEAALNLVSDVLPASWRARPVRLRLGARLRTDDGSARQLRIEVDEFALGHQRLPTLALRVLVDPAALGLLRLRLPDHVRRVGIEPGRVVIRTAS